MSERDEEPGRRPNLVSVIVPVHNAAGALEQQLLALADQTYSDPWELVIVDNNSTDDLEQVVSAFSGRVPRVRRVLAFEGRGAAYARNVGVQATEADALAFTDADDVVARSWLASLVDALSTHDISTGPLREWNSEACPLASVAREAARRQEMPGGFTHIPSNNFAVWRDVHLSIGCFNEAFVDGREDVEYALRAHLHGLSVGFTSDAEVSYRARGSLAGLFRQQYGYGKGSVRLEAAYADELGGRRTGRTAAHLWGYYMLRTPHAMSNRRARRLWIKNVGQLVGRLVASTQQRTWAP